MTLSAVADQAVRATGLPKATCMTLLDAGWTLEVRMNEPTRWESPVARAVVNVETVSDPRAVAADIAARIEEALR